MAACVQYLAPDGYYRDGVYTHTTADGVDHYRPCGWAGYFDGGTIATLAIGIVIVWLVLRFLPIRLPKRKATSSIAVHRFVSERIPPRPARFEHAPVDDMTWYFTDFPGPNDHTVRLYLAISEEERALIDYWGLNEQVYEEEPAFDESDLAALKAEQDRELSASRDDEQKASLRIEHQQQMKQAREQKITRTIDDFLQWPYERAFDSRYRATQYRNKLENTVLPNIKKDLDRYRQKANA